MLLFEIFKLIVKRKQDNSKGLGTEKQNPSPGSGT